MTTARNIELHRVTKGWPIQRQRICTLGKASKYVEVAQCSGRFLEREKVISYAFDKRIVEVFLPSERSTAAR
jgi:hypothetical protein